MAWLLLLQGELSRVYKKFFAYDDNSTMYDSRKFMKEKCNINSAKKFPILMNIDVIG